jgi:hypothetical protein
MTFITLYAVLRLSIYTTASLAPYDTPSGLQYITKSGAVLSDRSTAISIEVWGQELPRDLWIPALRLIDVPAWRVLDDTGRFKPGVIDVFVDVSRPEAIGLINELKRHESSFCFVDYEEVNGREIEYIYVLVYEVRRTPVRSYRNIPE